MRRLRVAVLALGFPLLFGAAGASRVFGRVRPSEPEATRAAEAMRLRMPEALRPASVRVRITNDLGSAERGVLALPETGTLVVDERALPLPESVWAHELGHLALGPIRGRGAVEERALLVLHEGIADAIAGATTLSEGLGDARELRDLGIPPRVLPESWALLGAAAFDPHPAGWALASALRRAASAHPTLLADVAGALRGYRVSAHESPARVLSELVGACPEATRATLRTLLAEWSGLDLPETLENP